MYRTLVGSTMTLAPLAIAVAAFAVGYSATHPTWWSAAMHLAVLGGITMMIYAVNIRIVPVFGRRPWRTPYLLRAQVAVGLTGAWLVFLGLGWREAWLERLGQALALAGGILFMVNIVRLFHQKAAMPGPPLKDERQAAVDKIAIGFTKLSAFLLLFGLIIGAMLAWWRPETGRWDLVWAHTMLVGWFMTMASGVCYHVLSRWTGTPWRSIGMIRLHYTAVAWGLPFMLLALAADWDWLFLVAGPLQALAILVFLANILPLVARLSGAARAGIALAVVFLVIGVGLGVMFAFDAAAGPRLRQVHVMANLFGWAGLLVSGFGYRFVPNFSNTGLRWPRLAAVQVAVMALGVVAGMYAMWDRMENGGGTDAVQAATTIVGVGMLLLTAQVAGTFMQGGKVASKPIMPSVRSRVVSHG
jgi:hypothetical protein